MIGVARILRIGSPTARSIFVTAMGSYVGLNPSHDINWIVS